MSDIEKINIIHKLKEIFKDINKSTIDKLVDQIDDNNIKQNIDRFFRGYKVEDSFKFLFSALPWVKEITALDQNQSLCQSKKDYQTPDYLLFFENCKMEKIPLLLEVKSVKGQKETLELMHKQVIGLKKYAKDLGHNLLFAIYWNKINYWTINSIESFEKKKKKWKITLFQAIENDLAIIFGDLFFLLTKPIYRKSIFPKITPRKSYGTHKKYGNIDEEYISCDKENWKKLELFESAFLDSSLKMKEIKKEQQPNGDFVLFEKNVDSFSAIKLSAQILRHLGICSFDVNGKISNSYNVNISCHFILEFMKKIEIDPIYMVPGNKNSQINTIIKLAFENSWVLDAFQKPDHRID